MAVKNPRNICGPKVRFLRDQLGWSQPKLAEKCQLIGWDISREGIAKIEGQIRWVGDSELVKLAKALGVSVEKLLPKI